MRKVFVSIFSWPLLHKIYSNKARKLLYAAFWVKCFAEFVEMDGVTGSWLLLLINFGSWVLFYPQIGMPSMEC